MSIIDLPLVQGASRFRNDDGSETTATWKDVQGANVVFGAFDLDVNFRIRIPSGYSSDVTPSIDFSPQLQYNLNSAGWIDVNASSSVVRSFLSSNITDDEATTIQLSGNPATFVAGVVDEVDGLAPSIHLDDDENTEHEFVLRVRSVDVINGDDIELRLIQSPSTPYNVYINIPKIHVILAESFTLAGFQQFFSEIP